MAQRTAAASTAASTAHRGSKHGIEHIAAQHSCEHSSTARRIAAGAHDVADLLLPQPHVGVEHAVVELLLVRVDQLPHLQVEKRGRRGGSGKVRLHLREPQ